MSIINYDECLKVFSKHGLSKLYHVVIPTSRNIPKMSNIVRRMRNFSPHFLIVRGMKEGVHYHALAYIPCIDNIRPATKYTTRYIPLSKGSEVFFCRDDYHESEVASEKSRSIRVNRMCRIIPSDAVGITSLCSFAISQYWKTLARASAKKIKSDKKTFHISGVYHYLLKNHSENSTQNVYETWQHVQPRK